MNEKLSALLQDEAAAKKLLSLETSEEIQAMLAENDIELTLEEITQIKKAIEVRLSSGDSEELSDDDLENVAGGFADIITGIIDIATTIGDWIHEETRGRW